MKPTSIRRFDLFYLGSIAFSLVGYLVSYNAMVAQMETRTAAAGMQLGSGTVIASMVVGLAVNLLLWFFVSRKASAIAKWIIIVFVAIGLVSAIGLPGAPGLFSGQWTVLKTISAVALLCELAAVFYLFQPDAKAWLAGETTGGEEPVDASLSSD